MVQSRFLKQPERIAAPGLVFVLALRLWRRVERPLRVPGETTETPVAWWTKKAT
jgi:hypothetical protein